MPITRLNSLYFESSFVYTHDSSNYTALSPAKDGFGTSGSFFLSKCTCWHGNRLILIGVCRKGSIKNSHGNCRGRRTSRKNLPCSLGGSSPEAGGEPWQVRHRGEDRPAIMNGPSTADRSGHVKNGAPGPPEPVPAAVFPISVLGNSTLVTAARNQGARPPPLPSFLHPFSSRQSLLDSAFKTHMTPDPSYQDPPCPPAAGPMQAVWCCLDF